MLQQVKYAVILLNYNTAYDSIIAAKSIVDNAGTNDYVICFVDNCSTRKGEVESLRKALIPNSYILELQRNEGYAKGNNEGVRFLRKKISFQYLVIMNPDVKILQEKTIDSLIEKLSKLDSLYCGIQPLIWSPVIGDDPTRQICIRRVCDYFDCIIDNFFLLKKILKKKYSDFVYSNERPYVSSIDFEVPSGCFFIIKSSVYNKVGMFDERTFLYAEELILGYKLKLFNYKFLLDPSFFVQHEGGGATGVGAKTIKWVSTKESVRSLSIYMRYYLRCNNFQIWLVKSLSVLNYLIKKVFYFLKS